MKKIELALGYKNPNVIKKHASELGISLKEAEIHFEECKKFLYLCSITDNPLSPSKGIDAIWHTFILFTKDYNNFCLNYLGRFVHHTPDVERTEQTRMQNKTHFEYARTLAETTFGSENLYSPFWYKNTKEVALAGTCDTSANCGGCTDLSGNCHGCKEE